MSTTKSTPQLNSVAARRLLTNIERDLRANFTKTKTDDPLERTLTRVRDVLAVGLMPSGPSGFSATTPLNGSPGGGGGRFLTIDDENGQPDRVPITSVEQAALNDHNRQDEINGVARRVLAELATIQAALSSLGHALDRFDHLRQQPTEDETRQCYVTKHILKMVWQAEWEPYRKTDLGGLLDEPRDVCKWVYWFHQDNRRLPTAKEAQTYIERQVVRLYA